MEQSDSMNKVTPYKLATLASRINPERCTSEPKGAIAAAQELLFQAKLAIGREEADRRERKDEAEAILKEWDETHVDWARGVKKITKEGRRDRAIKLFTQFMKHEPSEHARKLSHYRRDGFTLTDVFHFEDCFTDWKRQPKPKKGKQGRRISDHDGRLRTELVGLVPKKPQKRV
jgi:hypothetical protein